MTFEITIRNVLNRGELKDQYVNLLMNKIDIYRIAFTSPSVDPENNYEVYEQLGDATAGHFLVWYFYNRFPQLRCPKGVKVVARLKINYSSKRTFYRLAEKLGFWNHIRASQEERDTLKKSLLEDVFEAFIGVTEKVLNDNLKIGVGYAIVYRILKSLFDEEPISLAYEDLYDAKSRLKEYADAHKDTMGALDYRYDQQTKTVTIYSIFTDPVKKTLTINLNNPREVKDNLKPNVDIIGVDPSSNTITIKQKATTEKRLASAKGTTKPDTEQVAAQTVINSIGIKSPPDFNLVC